MNDPIPGHSFSWRDIIDDIRRTPATDVNVEVRSDSHRHQLGITVQDRIYIIASVKDPVGPGDG